MCLCSIISQCLINGIFLFLLSIRILRKKHRRMYQVPSALSFMQGIPCTFAFISQFLEMDYALTSVFNHNHRNLFYGVKFHVESQLYRELNSIYDHVMHRYSRHTWKAPSCSVNTV